MGNTNHVNRHYPVDLYFNDICFIKQILIKYINELQRKNKIMITRVKLEPWREQYRIVYFEYANCEGEDCLYISRSVSHDFKQIYLVDGFKLTFSVRNHQDQFLRLNL